ncbi:MAG TPA: PrsW family intramembrane metalloprotease [Lachnospiraceae bacterium]|nr:PrsW family intramembrane metalloprotease [Lachnospiraceae bacterium]
MVFICSEGGEGSMIFSENILICMALPLLLTAFLVRDNARRLVINFIIGMAACLLGAYVSGFIDVITGYGTEDTAIFISPVVEELMKFLPLLFYSLMFEPEDDRLFNAAVGIGAGFASYENVCSMITTGTESLGFLLIRGLAVGVMHIVSVCALTLGLVLAKHYKVSGLSTMLGALSVGMLFHGIYNLLASESGISSWVGFSLPLITAVLMLLAYRRLQTK